MRKENVARWKTLEVKLDRAQYSAILSRLEYQAGAAELWRDAICEWFFKTSGIADAQSRVGHHPNRVEAQSMTLAGYKTIDVAPWEDASGGKAVACESHAAACTATTKFVGGAGAYTIEVRYFDQNEGVASFTMTVNGKQVAAWQASDNLPTKEINGTSSTRRRIASVALKPGDTIQITGTPNGGDKAALDYIEFIPAR